MTNIMYKLNYFLLFLFLLIKLSLNQNSNDLIKEEIIYPSVLSLKNSGFVVIKSDGIYFFDSYSEEDKSKKIKFKSPILTKEQNNKISMSQFPEKKGRNILLFVIDKIYIFDEDGNVLQELNLEGMDNCENIKIIPYKKKIIIYFILFHINIKIQKQNSDLISINLSLHIKRIL